MAPAAPIAANLDQDALLLALGPGYRRLEIVRRIPFGVVDVDCIERRRRISWRVGDRVSNESYSKRQREQCHHAVCRHRSTPGDSRLRRKTMLTRLRFSVPLR